MLTAEFLTSMKYGRLKIKEAVNTHPTSHSKVEWICDCGKTTIAIIANVTRGLTKSCGRCNELPKNYWNKKFGKIQLKEPKGGIKPGSEKLESWICDCGNEFQTKICYVVSGDTKSCGKCSIISTNDVALKTFGRLRIEFPRDIKPGSHEKISWSCSCGGSIRAHTFNVTRGFTTNCGKCFKLVKKWYGKNEELIRALKTPIKAGILFGGPLELLEEVTNTGKPVQAKCSVCKHTYMPIWDNIRLGRSLTCGCTTNQTSGAQIEISEFIKSCGVETKLEHKIGDFQYDIFIPSKNVLIEYNGLRWHSVKGSKERDLSKYSIVVGNFDYIMIFEDEWLRSRNKVEALLQNRLGIINSKALSPRQCETVMVSTSTANELYEKYHYIGKCRAKFNYGVMYQNELIACQSFSRPTRQSSHSWELLRMVCDPRFRIHGIWSKLLQRFISENSPDSIVSFSDNRLFNGKVYEKMGFKYNGEVIQDYYWTKQGKRFHKSGLRKTDKEKESGLTEYELREAEGYKRIWDLGKKRWVWLRSS